MCFVKRITHKVLDDRFLFLMLSISASLFFDAIAFRYYARSGLGYSETVY